MPWMQDHDISFACTGFMQPNFTIFGRIDCVRPCIVWPLSENECEIIIYHLFPEEVFKRPDIEEKLKIYRDYQLQVLGEDQSMVERSEEHTSELQSIMRISYAVFCLKKKKKTTTKE